MQSYTSTLSQFFDATLRVLILEIIQSTTFILKTKKLKATQHERR